MTCFHIFLSRILRTCCLVTPKRRATSAHPAPSLSNFRISKISDSFSLAMGCLEPFLRSLSATSWEFVLRLPINKCSGLKHGGLSHLWQIKSLLPKSNPKNIHADTRCIRRVFPSNHILPYPLLNAEPRHSQHPSLVTCLEDSSFVKILSLVGFLPRYTMRGVSFPTLFTL